MRNESLPDNRTVQRDMVQRYGPQADFQGGETGIQGLQGGDKDSYPVYDNYDAIEVKPYNRIPKDYEGKMGVSFTYFFYYPDLDYEIVEKRTDLHINGKATIPTTDNTKEKWKRRRTITDGFWC